MYRHSPKDKSFSDSERIPWIFNYSIFHRNRFHGLVNMSQCLLTEIPSFHEPFPTPITFYLLLFIDKAVL